MNALDLGKVLWNGRIHIIKKKSNFSRVFFSVGLFRLIFRSIQFMFAVPSVNFNLGGGGGWKPNQLKKSAGFLNFSFTGWTPSTLDKQKMVKGEEKIIIINLFFTIDVIH